MRRERAAIGKRARRIWARHNGPIPKDDRGITFDVHHRDGNWRNNSLDNLQALSVYDHYLVHFAQGDWMAAWYIAKRLILTPDECAEIGAKISVALKGRIITPEWRQKISAALKGRKIPRHIVDGWTAKKKGRKFPSEFGQAISDRQRGRVYSAESRLKMSISHQGHKASDATKLKMSLARKGKPKNPDAIARMVATRYARGSYGQGVR